VGWARAKIVVEEVMRRSTGAAKVDVGYARKIGEGLSREVFGALVTVPGTETQFDVVAQLPAPRRRGAPARDPKKERNARTRKEARLLEELASHSLPFRVPRIYGLEEDEDGLAIVRGFEPGIVLDLRADQSFRTEPWKTVAAIAGAIHQIPTASLLQWMEPKHRTRRDHGAAILRELRPDSSAPEVAEALSWMTEHLPPATPSVLLHGDLLGQNILLSIEKEQPDAVIDWELAQLGDPAYDLAIVTRCKSKPFQIGNGRERLLDAYARAVGSTTEVTPAHLAFQELAFAIDWFRVEPAEHVRGMLRNTLRRAVLSAG
jgi:aminoglycoside phosphotransferase (APT) family kinase protein